jgi:hypothetical protein
VRSQDLHQWYQRYIWTRTTGSSSTTDYTYTFAGTDVRHTYANTHYLKDGTKMDLFRMPKKEGDPYSNAIVFRVGRDRWIMPHVHGGVSIITPEVGKTLVHDAGYYNQMAVSLTESFLEREAKAGVRPMFEIRDKKGQTILSTPNMHWAVGFGIEKSHLISYVIQHTCGKDSGTDCNCFIMFSSSWVKIAASPPGAIAP